MGLNSNKIPENKVINAYHLTNTPSKIGGIEWQTGDI